MKALKNKLGNLYLPVVAAVLCLLGYAAVRSFSQSIDYVDSILVLIGVNIILASSLNVINGMCGLFSLGHAGFFAVGAYSSAVFTTMVAPSLVAGHPMLGLALACVVGMVAAALIGLVVGIPCLRLTGDYLAIATVGFGEIIRIVLLNMDAVGGSRGMPGISKLTNLWIVVIVVVVVLTALNNLRQSSFGRCIVAIKENEIAARSMGVNVRFYKTFSFVVGSMLAGLAGGLFAHYQEFLHPNSFSFMVSVQILLMIVLGGVGSQIGAIIGAVIVTVLPEALRFQATLSQARMLIFGIVMVVVMLAMPEGLSGLFNRKKVANE